MNATIPLTYERGAPLFSYRQVAFSPNKCKAGVPSDVNGHKNFPPEDIPASLIGVKRPQFSTDNPIALVTEDRVGRQLGAYDLYRDTPYSEWTKGTQYYTVFVGENPRLHVPFVLYPQSHRAEVWAQDDVTFAQVNKNDTQDITELSLDHTCKSCDVPSASLGTPVYYQSHIPRSPLPVQPPGSYPNIGEYSARFIGRNMRDWPQPVNPILELQRRNAGLPSAPIAEDYDNELLGQLRNGFDVR